ncbi:unnamed protein product, partial [Ascophyllum nodosum]
GTASQPARVTVAAPVEDDATKTRLRSKTLTADQPQKMMRGYRLPNVPETVPSNVLDDMASRQGLVYVHLGTESSTHGVGLFAVKDMKTGHFT